MKPSRDRARAVAAVAASTFGIAMACVAACSPGPLDLTNKQCPCTDGWICDPKTDRCVGSLPPDAPPADGAVMPTTETVDDAGSVPTVDGSAADDAASLADGSDGRASQPVDASAETGGGPLDGLLCPPPYGGATAIVDDAGPVPDGGKQCRVHSDGILRCTNDQSPLFVTPTWGAAVVDDMWSMYTGYICFDYGDKHPNGNSTWYVTCGNRNKVKGYVSAKLLHTSPSFDADPSRFGLPRCPPRVLEPARDGGSD